MQGGDVLLVVVAGFRRAHEVSCEVMVQSAGEDGRGPDEPGPRECDAPGGMGLIELAKSSECQPKNEIRTSKSRRVSGLAFL